MPQPSEHEIEAFNLALELPPAERAAYLDKACAGDAALRQRVEELLKASEESSACLDDPSAVSLRTGGTVRPALSPAEKPGDRIGRYKLLQQIGEGGCGVVYMAEQEEPVRRRVALKVIKLGMDRRDARPWSCVPMPVARTVPGNRISAPAPPTHTDSNEATRQKSRRELAELGLCGGWGVGELGATSRPGS